ncbi:WD40 repeat domain-containing protein [Streptomyces sp. NPDC003027]
MTGPVRVERPAPGRETEAAALLGWLTDPDAPRLCLVTGGPRRGKSALLAWLAAHGTRSGGSRRGRAGRELIELAGQSALGAAWTIANRLGVVAGTPGELVHVLATTEVRRAALILSDLDEAAEPEALAELIAELDASGRMRLLVETRTGTPPHTLLAARHATVVDLGSDECDAERPGGDDALGRGDAQGAGRGERADGRRAGLAERGARRGPGGSGSGHRPGVPGEPAEGYRAWRRAVDPADPVAVCAADPSQVTRAYLAEPGDDHGGLRSAWIRAGQSLSREQGSADRAVVLLAALGDGADPRLRPALEELTVRSPWRVRWTRARGDLTPPWPGPVTALGAVGDQLLVAGPTGDVHLLQAGDARPAGRLLPGPAGRVKALAPAADGTVLLLDERGRLHAVRGAAPRPAYLERLTQAVTATLTRHPGTALAAIGGSVVVGDRLGSVHAFGLTGIHQAALHSGRVAAVTAVETSTPFVCSGGTDGAVRLWTPGKEPNPHPAPLAERPAPVVTLHAAQTPRGPVLAVAWADGLVELRHLDTGALHRFRPGPPVRAVAVTPEGDLIVGMDDALVRLEPAGGAR